MDSSRSILFDQSVGGQTHDQNEKTIDETIADTIDETNSGQNDSQSAETIAEQRIGALDDTIDNPIDDTTSGQPESRSDDNTVPIVNDIDDNSTEIGINSNANIVDKNDGTVGDTTADIFGDQSDDSVDHRLVIDIDRDSHNRVVSVVQSVIDTTVHSDTDTVQHYRVSDIGANYSNPIIAVNDTNDDNGLSVNEANNGIPINTDTDGQCLGTTSAETSDNTQLRTPTRIQSTTGLPESPTQEDLDSLNDEMFALAVNKLGTCGRNFGKWMTRFSNASAKCIEMASSQMSGRVSTSIDNFIAEPMDDTDVSMDQSLSPDIIPTESGYLETISGSNQKVIQLYGHLTNANAVKDKQRLFESYQKSSYMGWEVLTGRTVHQFVFFRLYSPCCPICGQDLATGPNSTVHDIHNHMKVKHYMMNTSTLIHAKLHIVS